MDKICAFCKRPYEPVNAKQKYCCKSCSTKAHWQTQRERTPPERTCQNCGKTYCAWNASSKYCSRGCSFDARVHIDESEEVNRDMAYLCQKWRREDMQISAIAEIIRRSRGYVERALTIQLPSEDYNKMAEYRR